MTIIRLVDQQNILHAEGDVENSKLSHASVFVRGELYYRFVGFRNGVPTFEECSPPLLITEF